MAKIAQKNIFSWKEIDAASDLNRLRLVLSVLPDEELMLHLESRRGRGRDDYPIRPTWNALIAGIIYQHPSAASLLRELWRNGELRELCGFEPFGGAAAVPSDDAFGRFLALLLNEEKLLADIFDRLLEQLGELLPELGCLLAVDSKAIHSHGRPVKDEEKKAETDRRRDADADWGVKTYKGTRADGGKWEKVKAWFGYKLHLVVDSVYELPLGFELTVASAGDTVNLTPLIEDLAGKHPEIAARAEELAADKGYDSAENNREIYDDYGIKPVIDKRTMWKDGETTRPLDPERVDQFVYDETGRVFCVCPITGEMRDMFHFGFEKDRAALKYRCPAAALGVDCQGRAECEARAAVGVGEFGRTVRVPLDLERRIFTPIARHTEKWKKAYARRTSVERVNSRIDNVLGFEHHYIRGLGKMRTRVTLALIVMLAMALGRIREDQAELMRSLTKPVIRAA